MFKSARNRAVHLAKLRAMTLVKNNHHMLSINRVGFVQADKTVQLLDGGYQNFLIGILKVLLQNARAGVAICRAFFKLFIFEDGLVVQVLAVHHK